MKSISFMIMLFLAGISVIACKEAKPAETDGTATQSELGVLTSDSLNNLRLSLTNSLTQIGTLLDQQIADAEASLAAADESAKEQLTLTLEQLKKVKTNVEAGAAKINAATDETWATIYQELEPTFYEAKSMLRGDAGNPSAAKKPGTSPETPASEFKK